MDCSYKGKLMGKLKSYLEDWLDEYGYDLGFSWDNLPNLGDLDNIITNQTDAKEYYNAKKTKSS
tara:strand:+ start:254 stop:445 length:192 start_codon:yes stop_codon:yes gene_type:complete